MCFSICGVEFLLLELLLLAGEQGVYRGVELVTALQEVELEDEDVADDLSAELGDELTSG